MAMAVIATERDAIAALSDRIDADFDSACELLLGCQGRVVVTGMGKSGHIGNKIAATLASTGTPAFFVHPGEASHGDLGMICADDVVIALSNSGESDEIATILPLLKRMGVKLISLTGRSTSTLAQAADVNLNVAVAVEACPLNLAPTSSTTAALVMGDALAIALLDARGFKADDFALSHPGGSLGRRLLVHVRDVMHTGEAIPQVSPTANLRDAILEMSSKGLGLTMICDAGQAIGVFTDGDIRRALDTQVDVNSAVITDVMTSDYTTIVDSELAATALEIMERKKINSMPVTNAEGQLVGALNIHDLLRAGVA